MPRERTQGDTPAPSHDEIARRAHEICVARGSEPGHELDDWLAAEKELQARRSVAIETHEESPKARTRNTRAREASA
jgi:hypothetical protein